MFILIEVTFKLCHKHVANGLAKVAFMNLGHASRGNTFVARYSVNKTVSLV